MGVTLIKGISNKKPSLKYKLNLQVASIKTSNLSKYVQHTLVFESKS